MTDRYFSRYYRGFLLEQTDKGWIIHLQPTRTASGVISPGPYGTMWIARHVVDQIIDEEERHTRNKEQSGRPQNNEEYEYEYREYPILPILQLLFIAIMILDIFFNFIP